MKNRERHIEPLGEALDELRREADLRHQYERTLTARERTLHYLQVHLGLAATGDAVENERAELIPSDSEMRSTASRCSGASSGGGRCGLPSAPA